MNIAILIPTLKQGGAEKQATLLASILDKYHRVDLFLLYGGCDIAPQNKDLLKRTNVTLHYLKGGLISKFVQLKRELRTSNTDILFNYLTSCNVIGGITGRFAGVKRIYGGIRNARLEWSKMVVERFIHNHIATGTIYNCYSGAEYFSNKGFKQRKNIIIPNGFQDIAEPITRTDREIKHIVTTGRFVPQKDYRTMLRTISKLKDIRQDFVMDIIGYGVEEDNIRKWIEEFGISKYINIHIKPDNVQDIVKDADIYLSTSLFEGTSNSIMEALNWSLPIVATNVGDNKHLVEDLVNGFLHNIADADNIALSLAKLLSDIELRNRYGSNSHKILTTHFSMDIFENSYLQLINQG